ncbi:uncharacterized protein si:ch73-103b9.2 [Thunnus thynnus]|uniref:uncharacterized protein si:ch73-103b9.2 n=1 Tax=Thunnus thynnus TaxID=8237 RepID=UPI00352715A4
MATLEEMDHTAVNGSDKEDATGEQPYKTAERTHVDALLDISEENFLTELEPHEYHCYSGWEEAVRGWARVAPLSCIFLPQKRDWKPKSKEPDNLTPLSVDPTIRNVDSSAGNAEPRSELQVGPPNSLKKSIPLNQQTGTCSHTTAAAPQPNPPERPALGAMQKNMSHLLVDEKIEEEGALRETSLQPHHLPSKYPSNRPTKPQKHSHRSNNTMVPIKNFTFLPPINSPHVNPQRVSGQLCSGKKAPEGETLEENCYMFDKRSSTRGSRMDSNPELPTYAAAPTSKHRTCQYNPYLLSTGSVSIPKRFQVPMSSKPDIVHHTSYSVGKSLTQALHSSTAAGAQAHMTPSCLFS